MNRRKFIKQAGIVATGLSLVPSQDILANYSAAIMALPKPKVSDSLHILHTNDVHSRLDPFPMDGSKNQGKGGVVARKRMIDAIRKQEKNVLLLDCGDIFQGTPYFNMYKGEPEIKAMSMMGYDACTMGNHDFDGGIQNFANQLQHANFDVVVCNYDFTNTPLENIVKPYVIKRKGDLKIGIIGVGIELDGLVPKNLYGNTTYHDPVEPANRYAKFLKKQKKCDMVICLSHLGFEYTDEKISDKIFAKKSQEIDLILGGHTHTLLKEPFETKNAHGKPVLVNQVGWGGIVLGSLQFDFFHKNDIKKILHQHTVLKVK
jgi:5'-nucleotidase